MQLFSAAISLGNKMNFSLYVNMAGFCSDGQICKSIVKYDTSNNNLFDMLTVL